MSKMPLSDQTDSDRGGKMWGFFGVSKRSTRIEGEADVLLAQYGKHAWDIADERCTDSNVMPESAPSIIAFAAQSNRSSE